MKLTVKQENFRKFHEFSRFSTEGVYYAAGQFQKTLWKFSEFSRWAGARINPEFSRWAGARKIPGNSMKIPGIFPLGLGQIFPAWARKIRAGARKIPGNFMKIPAIFPLGWGQENSRKFHENSRNFRVGLGPGKFQEIP